MTDNNSNYDKFTLEHGAFLVRLARRAIEEYLRNKKILSTPPNTPPNLLEKSGAFVTLNKLINDHEELRGCIGYLLPVFPLVDTVIKAAIAAATEDPRFPPVTLSELDRIIVEVTILTPPQEIQAKNPEELISKIKIGRDGLIVQWHNFSGTLLPQVPVEYGWDAKEFLINLCYKAGLPSDCWKWPETKLYKYQGVIFKETRPNGPVIRVKLEKTNKN